jgi:flagellar motor switch protein FliN
MTMNSPESNAANTLLENLADGAFIDDADAITDITNGKATASVERPRRNIPEMMRKIPVTLTLEVGSARISLHDLMSIENDSVVELDRLAGEPLVIKVNGTPIGRAEVVVSGENYGLKVIDLDGLNMDAVAP